MNLRAWLDKSNMDVLEAAKTFGVSVFAVKKWLKGERTPRGPMQIKIKKMTKGQVDGNSWMKD